MIQMRLRRASDAISNRLVRFYLSIFRSNSFQLEKGNYLKEPIVFHLRVSLVSRVISFATMTAPHLLGAGMISF